MANLPFITPPIIPGKCRAGPRRDGENHKMRRLCLFGFGILALLSAEVIHAEEPGTQSSLQGEPAVLPVPETSDASPQRPRFRGRPLVLDITARVIEQNQTVIWNESHKKDTIPGRPVGIKMVGTNIVVEAQFTPYVRRGGQKFLVAQGQIWLEVPNQGIRYHTSMQTIPLEFGEPIYFFPLGSQRDGDAASIEVMLTLYPHDEE
jgi:hypothetical protein